MTLGNFWDQECIFSILNSDFFIHCAALVYFELSDLWCWSCIAQTSHLAISLPQSPAWAEWPNVLWMAHFVHLHFVHLHICTFVLRAFAHLYKSEQEARMNHSTDSINDQISANQQITVWLRLPKMHYTWYISWHWNNWICGTYSIICGTYSMYSLCSELTWATLRRHPVCFSKWPTLTWLQW